MREIDALLDTQPELAREMIEYDHRNRQAHKELQLYNDHKTFLYKHPIVSHRKAYEEQFAELYELKRANPNTFINEITNVTQNIRRIQSNLNKQKYKSTEEKQSWEQNLSRAEIRKKILEEVINK
jgi:hypothetical protein